MNKLPNEACRDQANLALEQGNPEQAIAWINTAYARTLGHNKSARYEAWARKIAQDHGIEHHSRYAEDSEAV